MRTPRVRSNLDTIGIILAFYALLISFTVFTQVEFAPVHVENIKTVTARYESYVTTLHSGSEIHFLDGTSLDARWNSFSLIKKLDKLAVGETLTMLVHPNGRYILEMRHGEDILYAYEDNVKELNTERRAFLVIGITATAILTFGLISPALMKKSKSR